MVIVSPGYFELDSIVQISRSIHNVRELFNPELQLAGFLFTMSDPTVNSKTSLQILRQTYTGAVFNSVIPRNTDLRDAHFQKKDIFSYSPNAAAAQAYDKLIATLLEEACRQRLHTQHAVLLTSIVEQAIAKQMARERSRIAALLVRIAFDANQTRTLATNILGRQPRMNPDKLTTILDASFRKAKMDITRRSPQIQELITAVENWLNGVEEEAEPEST